jgi:branched-chain amino acid transport system substrate-binding protein
MRPRGQPRRGVRLLGAGMLLSSLALAAGLTAGAASSPPLLLGAVYPLHGELGEYAADEALGVDIAVNLANADGGVGGRRVVLDVRDLSTVDEAAPALDSLRADGAGMVLGGFASDLSMAASQAAADRGMLYWEAGAVADRITGRGLPLVFRVGATGGNLGANSISFAATQLAPRLGRPASGLRVSLVVADDLYARSVADAAVQNAQAAGMSVVSTSTYNLTETHFDSALATLRTTRPDLLLLVSHVEDGVAFRRAFLAAGLHVGAFIGSTMAECGMDFGALLGADATGVFASDRPGPGFDPSTLSTEGRVAFDRFAAAWAERRGGPPSEDGIAGFSAAWALLHHVLPRAAAIGQLNPPGIAAVARVADLPAGSLPDGSGLRFATDPARLGQNLRAAAVIWQWQGVRRSVVVWPAAYATGTVTDVPLPR